MSIWGANFSENDDAADWLITYLESPDLLLLNETFDVILNADEEEYIDVTDGANCLIAASIFLEILTPSSEAIIIKNIVDLNNLKSSLIKMDKGALRNMLKRAIKSVNIVADLEDRSELRELMDEDHEFLQPWLSNTASLINNLTKKLQTM